VLVTVRELSAYMDRELTNRQQDAAEIVIDGIHSEMEAFLGRPIGVQSFNETFVVPDDNYWANSDGLYYDRALDGANSVMQVLSPPYQIHLGHAPVVSVETVTLYPISTTSPYSSPQVLDEGVRYIVRKWGIDVFAVWSGDKVQVEYEAGIPVNPYIKQVALRAAAREMQNMTDDVVGLKDFQNRQATIQEIGLTEAEKRGLDKFRRKQI